jgi:hypothetical protein
MYIHLCPLDLNVAFFAEAFGPLVSSSHHLFASLCVLVSSDLARANQRSHIGALISWPARIMGPDLFLFGTQVYQAGTYLGPYLFLASHHLLLASPHATL